MNLFSPEYDTLEPGGNPRFLSVPFAKTNWDRATVRHSVEWTDAIGVRHRARYDEYTEAKVDAHPPRPKNVKNSEPEIEKTPAMGSDEIERAIRAHFDETGLSERTSPASRFIWGGNWGR